MPEAAENDAQELHDGRVADVGRTMQGRRSTGPGLTVYLGTCANRMLSICWGRCGGRSGISSVSGRHMHTMRKERLYRGHMAGTCCIQQRRVATLPCKWDDAASGCSASHHGW